ncbi:MAG: glycerate kinase [Rhodospirillales bacterium]|nr:MAG: glycerate kinase [Rhodospirillales bacterium]
MTAASDPGELLQRMFAAAVAAAAPDACMPPHMPARPKGRTVVIGAGKASAAMARAVEMNWPGELSGLVVTRYGHAVPCKRIEVVEAAHPVPDENGVAAATRILELVRGLTTDDLVICLISGGGSALLTLPAAGLSLADKQQVNRALLRSGATISEMNCVRKHLSAIKGGRLAAAAWPAKIVTLVISDVPGDDPATIASGPTVADRTTYADARTVLRKYAINEPAAVLTHLQKAGDESPKSDDPRLVTARTVLIATPQASLEAAAKVASRAGVTPLILSDRIEGEASEVAKVHAGIALQIAARDQPAARPAVILSGGETTVTVKGKGRGGRNAEFLLSLAVVLEGARGIHAIACDTDGIDGSEDNAGALIGPETWYLAGERGIDLKSRLADNDAYGAFAALDCLVVTGPTLTNVNDFRAILVTS